MGNTYIDPDDTFWRLIEVGVPTSTAERIYSDKHVAFESLELTYPEAVAQGQFRVEWVNTYHATVTIFDKYQYRLEKAKIDICSVAHPISKHALLRRDSI